MRHINIFRIKIHLRPCKSTLRTVVHAELTIVIKVILQPLPAPLTESSLPNLPGILLLEYLFGNAVGDIRIAAFHRQIGRECIIAVHNHGHIRCHLHCFFQQIHRDIDLTVPIELIPEQIRQHHIVRFKIRENTYGRRLVNLNTRIVRIQMSIVLRRQHESCSHTVKHI